MCYATTCPQHSQRGTARGGHVSVTPAMEGRSITRIEALPPGTPAVQAAVDPGGDEPSTAPLRAARFIQSEGGVVMTVWQQHKTRTVIRAYPTEGRLSGTQSCQQAHANGQGLSSAYCRSRYRASSADTQRPPYRSPRPNAHRPCRL
jgi:hypothetical protein